MMYDTYGLTATPGVRSVCPGCEGELLPKCGEILTWHWAHVAADCDPWSEPESEWHLGWKAHLASLGANVEVPMGPHRADAIMPSGSIVELQAGYLDVGSIAAREAFYGPMLRWIYRCTWWDRVHWGRYGFWWKHGSKAMATHGRAVWWHVDDALLRVQLSVVEHEGAYGFVDAHRVLGKVIATAVAPAGLPKAS